jgi:hypothetical protein
MTETREGEGASHAHHQWSTTMRFDVGLHFQAEVVERAL